MEEEHTEVLSKRWVHPLTVALSDDLQFLLTWGAQEVAFDMWLTISDYFSNLGAEFTIAVCVVMTWSKFSVTYNVSINVPEVQ